MTTGAAWNLDDPLKPWALFDPDSTRDIPFDWASWLADIGSTYFAHVILPDSNLEHVASAQFAGVIEARIRKASAGTLVVGTKYPVTCRITSTSGEIEDQTLWLKVIEK